MDKLGNIYLIKNLLNEKQYVGCTISTIKKRFEEHAWRCINSDSNTKFCNSIKKYGYENFDIVLLEKCEVGVIYEREKYYIEKYNTFKEGLNSTIGGEGCLGYVHSNEIREKISKKLKDGRSHKGKTYEDLYGDRKDIEIENRKIGVKLSWDKLTEDKKNERVEKSKNKLRDKSKYGLKLIKEIKNKFQEGLKVKDIKILYPFFPESYLYSIKNNKRWKNI